MDLNRFKECSAAFGAERHRWPPREHPLYDRYAETLDGTAILAEAERADRFLDALEPAVPDRRMTHNMARSIVALSRPRWRRLGVPAAALAGSAVLGFVLGVVQVRQVRSAADTDFAAQLLLGPMSLQETGL